MLIMHHFKYFYNNLLNIIFRPSCLLCGEAVTQPYSLCSDCWSKLTFIVEPLCDICGVPFPVEIEGQKICCYCEQQKPIYEKARAVVRFDEPGNLIIYNLKYYDRLDYVPFVANMLLNYTNYFFKDIDIITGVPMYRDKIKKRKYNQAMLLSKYIANKLNIMFIPNLLYKIKDTRSQSEFSYYDRQKNIADAFAINPNYRVIDKKILIIDDVITTGATINECAKVLFENGKNKTFALSFARTY